MRHWQSPTRNKLVAVRKMASDSESEYELKPLISIMKAANVTSLNLIPETSKKKYETAYKAFMDWQTGQDTTSLTEDVLLAFFGEKSKKYQSSTLWTQYSMLRTTLSINHNVDIGKYAKLKAFLKRQSRGYQPKKSKIFTSEEIHKFINEAPDQHYLLTKTALIMGVMGACRRHELHQMKTTHLKDFNSTVLVKIPDTKAKKIVRTFTVTGDFYKVLKKYWNLRPANPNDASFFLNYHNGKCTAQKVGINKFGSMGKEIATYLQLPNPELYTGHCFRRSSKIRADAGDAVAQRWETTANADEGDMDDPLEVRLDDGSLADSGDAALNQHADWESTDESLENKFDVGSRVSTPNVPSSSRNQENMTFNFDTVPSSMTFNNCTITFNIFNKSSEPKTQCVHPPFK